MNNLLSYCGLLDPRISASDKDLSVLRLQNLKIFFKNEFQLIVAVLFERVHLPTHSIVMFKKGQFSVWLRTQSIKHGRNL